MVTCNAQEAAARLDRGSRTHHTTQGRRRPIALEWTRRPAATRREWLRLPLCCGCDRSRNGRRETAGSTVASNDPEGHAMIARTHPLVASFILLGWGPVPLPTPSREPSGLPPHWLGRLSAGTVPAAAPRPGSRRHGHPPVCCLRPLKDVPSARVRPAQRPRQGIPGGSGCTPRRQACSKYVPAVPIGDGSTEFVEPQMALIREPPRWPMPPASPDDNDSSTCAAPRAAGRPVPGSRLAPLPAAGGWQSILGAPLQ